LEEVSPLEAKTEELKDEPKPIEAKPELKTLPSHLKYVFLEEGNNKPVIISSSLSTHEEHSLIQVLKENEEAIGWALSDLKGISPSYCMHSIMMEEDYKPVAQPQHRLNPTMKEVVRKEVVKLLEAGMIYPISDSALMSPVQVVPKKGGMTVITNDKNELNPSRTVTGWRMCINYRRLSGQLLEKIIFHCHSWTRCLRGYQDKSIIASWMVIRGIIRSQSIPKIMRRQHLLAPSVSLPIDGCLSGYVMLQQHFSVVCKLFFLT
jgi:hypothetical protein